jgi:hypothetical protein
MFAFLFCHRSAVLKKKYMTIVTKHLLLLHPILGKKSLSGGFTGNLKKKIRY